MSVCVRCAPSPTGYLHIGVTRTALFNYLHARHCGGKFVVRIEDTDRERSKEEYTKSILEGFAWVGIKSDVPPIFQSQRQDYYQGLFDQLIREGKAYYCDCSKERLDDIRSRQAAAGETPRYDNHCRERKDVNPEGAVIRLKTPQEGVVVMDDPIYGTISWENSEIDDFVIAKSDGVPTYQFAVVADDHAQGVTIVIRGNDILSSTPKQILLFQALGWEAPRYAHLPMILGTDKQKLSKRHGATSLLAYRAMGYLPQAMCNYLVRLGWAYGDQEVFSMEEMIEKFTIESIGKSPAVFNSEKLLWLNGEHIRMLTVPQLTDAWINHLQHRDADQMYLEIGPGVPESFPPLPNLDVLTAPENRSWVEELVASCQIRSSTLVQLTDCTKPFLNETVTYDPKDVAKIFTAQARKPLEEVRAWVEANNPLPDEEAIHAYFNELAEKLGMGLGKVAQPVRLAVTGRTFSPPINTTLAVLEKSLGRKVLLERLDKALEKCPS